MSGINAYKNMMSHNSLHGAVDTSQQKSQKGNAVTGTSQSSSFADLLKESINQVNESQVTADKMTQNLATGKTENIHETMLSVAHAEVNFKFMVQLRNKALEAYQEIMRMPV